MYPQLIELRNVSDSPLTWQLHTDQLDQMDDHIFSFTTSAGEPLPLPTAQPAKGKVGYLDPMQTSVFLVQCAPGMYVYGTCIRTYVRM